MSNIEQEGVWALSRYIARSKILEPFFQANDKRPSWDGDIIVYRESIKKKNIIGTIPVQIKSTKVNMFHVGKTSYSFDISDIRNYYTVRGTILFVVELSETEEYKVFVRSLLPSDLKAALAQLKREGKDNDDTSLSFQLFELNTTKQLEYICQHFLIHKNLQHSTIDGPSLSITGAAQLEIPLLFAETPFAEDIFSQEYLLYGKQSSETALHYIETIKLTSIGVSLNKNIVINSKLYFSQYTQRKTPDGIFFEFGNKITVSRHNDGTSKLSYMLNEANISQRIEALSFLVDVINNKTIYIGDGELQTDNLENKDAFLNEIQKKLTFWKDAEALFHYFRVDPNMLKISIFENSDISNLIFLVNVIIRKQGKQATPFQWGVNAIKIGNITLAALVYKMANETNYQIIDLFGKIDHLQFMLKRDNESGFASSVYLTLKHDFLVLVDNLNLASMLEDIKRINFSEGYAEAIIFWGLELIKAFDNSSRAEFLESAFNIFEWLQKMQYDNLICEINKLQIIRRQRPYTRDEKAFLIKEKTRNDVKNNMLCAIHILLENKSEAEIYFDLLEQEEKEAFTEYPIFTLANRLNILKNL